MRFIDPLYLAKNIRNEAAVRRKIQRGAGVAGLYLICLSEREDELLQIVHNSEFMHAPMKNTDPVVVGLARGYLTARLLVRDMISEIYEETGGLDVKAYFRARAGEDSR